MAARVTSSSGTLGRVKPLAVLVVFVGVAAAAPAPASACDAEVAAARVARIDAHLAREARRSRRWNVGWTLGFAGLAGGQLGLAAAEWTPIGEFDDAKRAGLHVGAVKAAVASVGRAVLPLRVARPRLTGDPCADLDAAERALRATAAAERRGFYLNHAATVAFGVAGLLVLGLHYDTWEEGWMSVALGTPVGLLSTYTMPRASWRADRDGAFEAAPAMTLGVARGDGWTSLVLSGEW